MNTIRSLTIVLACSLAFTACDSKKVRNEMRAQLQDTGIDRLQPGDTIAAKIHKSPDFDVEAKIDQSGKVFFRLIGNVLVSGLTIAELEEKLQQLYQKDFDLKTDVSVTLKNRGSPEPSAQAQAAGKYRLHSGDKIRMRIVEEPSIDTEAEIGESGNISFPLIGMVSVRGLSIAELEQKLMGMYRKDYLVDPKISVDIRGYAKGSVHVAGAVLKPGPVPYPLEGTVSLAQAVARAGGISEGGNDQKITIFRKNKSGSEVYSLVAGSKVELSRGDTVVVRRLLIDKEAKNITATITGEVKRPGKITLPAGGNIDVLTAVAKAGGFTRIANQKEAILQRKIGAGFRVVTLKLRDIRNGKAPMVFICEGDILIIKESRW